jgi:hypothetical protein
MHHAHYLYSELDVRTVVDSREYAEVVFDPDNLDSYL